MVTLTINNQAYLYPASKIPGSVLNQIKGRLTFPNPAHQEAERRGFSTWNVCQLVGILKNAGAILS